MDAKLQYLVLLICITSFSVNSQNLLDTSTWTVGSGSVSGYGQHGLNSENNREYGSGPIVSGSSVLLWKGSPDANGGSGGGFNTDFFNIDHLKTYRFSIWLKKGNSQDGDVLFGMLSNSNGVLNLNETIQASPYFLIGDLLELNKWYLVVGYVHGSTYNSNVNYSAIYDGLTGQKINSLNDFKFSSTALNTRLHCYLHNDSNTSDRQYFYAPRIELVDGNEPSVEYLLGTNNADTNLIDTNTWTVSSGSVSGFLQHGLTSENNREYGKNHIGKEEILWKASPDSNGGSSGGFSSDLFNIDRQKSHRFTIWLKKTNSNDGSSLYGCLANQNGILNLNGTVQNDPYFLIGDLPKLNRWYLLVGYVHHKNYNSSVNLGGIYDGTTGEKIQSLIDFKFNSNATNVRLHSYLQNDNNILDRKYFYSPRIDPIFGNEPTIEELLKINNDSKLIVSYDVSGNQTQNFYCNNKDFCSPPSAKKKIKENTFSSTDINEEEIIEDLSESVFVYPNPTSGYINIKLKESFIPNIHSISLYNVNSSLVKEISDKKEIINLDISELANGVYILHIHLKEGKSITKKIVKK